MILAFLLTILSSALVPTRASAPVESAEPLAKPWKAIWVSRWEYRSEEDVRTIVRNCARLGCEQVLFQVRGSADAFYRSSHEPWARELGGKDPGFDPLAVAVDESHRAGVELHAWVNVVPGWRGADAPVDRKHVYHRHPEWFLVDEKGQREALKENYYVALNPLLPEVREYLTAVLGELCSAYEIDGLHLDYIRFLERAPGKDYGYDARTLELYRKVSGKKPSADPKAWNEWRRAQITELVRSLRGIAVHRGRKLHLSAAVFPVPDAARENVLQDYPRWVQLGLLDRVCPMNYRAETGEFVANLGAELAVVPPEKLTAGIGLYLHAEPQRSVEQILRAKEKTGGGVSLFSYETLWTSRNPEQPKDPEADRLRARRRGAIRAALRGV